MGGALRRASGSHSICTQATQGKRRWEVGRGARKCFPGHIHLANGPKANALYSELFFFLIFTKYESWYTLGGGWYGSRMLLITASKRVP